MAIRAKTLKDWINTLDDNDYVSINGDEESTLVSLDTMRSLEIGGTLPDDEDEGKEEDNDGDEDDEDDTCRECGEATDNGEGWDGLCGNCSDRAQHEKSDTTLRAASGMTDANLRQAGYTLATDKEKE